jgi:hypothetical protein
MFIHWTHYSLHTLIKNLTALKQKYQTSGKYLYHLLIKQQTLLQDICFKFHKNKVQHKMEQI